ncbi:MAG: sugar phosphate isomerase/epimerase family protein [Methanocellales archaeon]|nr:sugar phosphate isomerase/epimerase family protein [Methanocellales archaeon]
MGQSVMRIGASTAIYWNYKEHDLPAAMKHMCDMGFSCVEILCEHPFYTNWATEDAEKEKESIKELLDSYELDVSVHAPYHDLNIASLNPGIRSETVRQLREAIEVASDLNAEVLVVHPGFVASRKYPRSMAHAIMVDTLIDIADYAGGADVVIGLENIADKPKALAVHATELVRTVADVGSKNLRVTFDVAHANTIGTPLIDFVDTLGKLIKHVHVSDNKGFDDHLPIGVGNIDYRAVLSKLIENGYKGLLIIEGWIPSDPDQFVKLSKDKLKDMLKGL